MTLPLLAVLALLVLAAAGCGDTTGRSDGDAGPGAGSSDAAATGPLPEDGTYVATEVTGRRLVEGTTLRITLRGGDLGADAGCNQMSGRASVVDARLRVGGLGMTEMGCAPGRMEQDEWVADLLTSEPRITATGDGFTLTGGGVTARFAPEAPPEDRPFEGTTWLLESTVEGDVASSSVVGPSDAAPRFRVDDGRVVASDGCNDLAGRVEVTEDRIVARGDLSQELRQCVRAVPPLDALLAGSTYLVEGDRLTLTRGGTSLVFRAE